jgi:hypothetical protein
VRSCKLLSAGMRDTDLDTAKKVSGYVLMSAACLSTDSGADVIGLP